MLYGRLDNNNNVVEIISQDPAGRYAAEIQWVKIHEDYALLTTKDKNALLLDIKKAQSEATESDFRKLNKISADIKALQSLLKIEKDKLEANGVDVNEVHRRSLLTQEERDAEDAAAAAAAEEAA